MFHSFVIVKLSNFIFGTLEVVFNQTKKVTKSTVINKFSTDSIEIFFSTSDDQIKIQITSIRSFKIYRDKKLDKGLLLVLLVIAFNYLLIYFYFDNTFFLNVIFILLSILLIREFVTIQKSKYYFVIIMLDKNKYKYKFNKNLKHEVFFIKNEVDDYLWNKLNNTTKTSSQITLDTFKQSKFSSKISG